ncbi:hypothetical protein K661_02737 [Piscirickettsia salmonis LF-89 = ATCC VR-1361]|nr:hypothetical protein K661_02737 [Piscirickettsia salmonis LF-89 = ATCC VR-1361]
MLSDPLLSGFFPHELHRRDLQVKAMTFVCRQLGLEQVY